LLAAPGSAPPCFSPQDEVEGERVPVEGETQEEREIEAQRHREAIQARVRDKIVARAGTALDDALLLPEGYELLTGTELDRSEIAVPEEIIEQYIIQPGTEESMLRERAWNAVHKRVYDRAIQKRHDRREAATSREQHKRDKERNAQVTVGERGRGRGRGRGTRTRTGAIAHYP
ncbi:hypothetical protein KIPB_002337, partial [Kipferlia bialata]